MFHRKINIPELTDRQWAERASPASFATSAGELNYAYRVARENREFLRRKFEQQAGVVVGYHGTSAGNAESIAVQGLRNMPDMEGYKAVSAWDSTAAHKALENALFSSQMAGETDGGRIVEVRMHDPMVDPKGRLAWFSDGRTDEIMSIMTPEEFRTRQLGHVAVRPEEFRSIAS